MVVVAIISMLAALAVPALSRARDRTRRTELVEDLRIIRDAFDMYATEHGSLPPDAAPGQIPAGMEKYFGTKVRWTASTPVGGRWDWDYEHQPGIKACVTVLDPKASVEEMLEVDAMLDDGSFYTGSFRMPQGFNYCYIIE